MCEERMHYEIEAAVTQLAATSEVAEIGLTATCLGSEIAEFEEWLAAVDDLAAGKTLRVRKHNSNDTMLRALGDTSIDNQHVQNSITVGDGDTTGVANQIGSNVRERLYSEQYLKATIIDTLDATKKMYFRSTYSAIANPLTLAVVGSGITLTTTKHEIV